MQDIAPNEIVLIRHAPADHDGRLCGRRDVPAIVTEGAQLAALRKDLANVPFVISSPALRCRQTAKAIWPDREIPQDVRLWEQDFGDHDGMAFADLPDLGPLSLAELAALRSPNGESFDQMAARVTPALRDAAQNAGPVAIVAHAGTVRAAIGMALGEAAKALAFEVAPLSMTRIRVFDGGFSIVTTNWQVG